MWVCICEEISDKKLKSVILSGACTLKDVSEVCYAGTGCGYCVSDIQEIIENIALEKHRLEKLNIPREEAGEKKC